MMPSRKPNKRQLKKDRERLKVITSLPITSEKSFGGIDMDLLIVDDIEGVNKEELIAFMEKVLGKKVDEASYQLFSKLFSLMDSSGKVNDSIPNPFKTFSRKVYPFPPLTNSRTTKFRGEYYNPLASTFKTLPTPVVEPASKPKNSEPTLPFNREPKKSLQRSIIL